MSRLMKLAMIIAIGAYVISPADAIPGPVDDLIIMLLGLAANKKLNAKKAAERDLSGKNFVEVENGGDLSHGVAEPIPAQEHDPAVPGHRQTNAPRCF